jgi:phosphate transport system protein
MTMHLQSEIENLKKKILYIGAMVEESLRVATQSLKEKNEKKAMGVIDGDFEIDRMEVELEEDCLKVLALHQPVAADLRFIVAVLKINNDLERIGDLSVNIAERVINLAACQNIDVEFDYSQMADKVTDMVKKSLDSLVNQDPGLAHQVCQADDEVDDMKREMFNYMMAGIKEHPDVIEQLIRYMLISRDLERIADHATNIAEDVIYMTEGFIVRHRLGDVINSGQSENTSS